MHADEVHVDVDTIVRLLANQFPSWSRLQVRPVPSAGTDNALFRLGDDLVCRFPRIPAAAAQLDKERTWLPALAPHLPLPIPEPRAHGRSGCGYPWSWSVYTWLDGTPATDTDTVDPQHLATDLSAFIAALSVVNTTDGPTPGGHNFGRGEPLAERDNVTRRAIAELVTEFDADHLTAVWESALATATWQAPPVWIHGDLMPGNLLVNDGRLSAVIDFGGLGVADPACDAMAAWTVMPTAARQTFRDALSFDDATWTRAMGWALNVGVVALPYYRRTNPTLAGIARRTIEAVLGDNE